MRSDSGYSLRGRCLRFVVVDGRKNYVTQKKTNGMCLHALRSLCARERFRRSKKTKKTKTKTDLRNGNNNKEEGKYTACQATSGSRSFIPTKWELQLIFQAREPPGEEAEPSSLPRYKALFLVFKSRADP